MMELEITKTKIGEKIGSYKGKYTIFSVYYGNYVSPTIDGEFVHLKRPEYEELLENFLASEEGQLYRRPDPEEIKRAEATVINSELIYLKNNESSGVELNLSTIKEAEANARNLAAAQERKKFKKLAVILTGFVILETVLSILFIST